MIRGFNRQYGMRVTDGRVDMAGDQGRWAVGRKWSAVHRLLRDQGAHIRRLGFVDPPWLDD